jgi:hypothetical protein
MSNHANPNAAFLWLDCDVYRAPKGTARPDLSKHEPGAEYEGWEAFGGLETGFAVTSEGAATPKRVMNYRQAPYKVGREPKVDTMTFRSVDASKAYLLTYLQGGEIHEFPDGSIELHQGTGEEFAILLVARDGADGGGYISDAVTTSTPPAEGAVDGDTMAGSEFSLIAIQPLRKFYSKRPEAVTEADVVMVDAAGKPTTGGGTVGE